MFDRAAVKFEIYTRLNKTPTTRGFYSDEKANSAVQESLDFLSTEMMLADEGFAKKLDHFDTTANMVSFELPPNMAMICAVRFLVGNVYAPLCYDSEFDNSQWSSVSGIIQFPSRYRLVDNRLYFNPAIGVGGTSYLQIEYMTYMKIMRQDSDKFEQEVDRAMIWFIVYNSMSIMASTMGQFSKPWADSASMWYQKALLIINKRVQQFTAIQDFEGY